CKVISSRCYAEPWILHLESCILYLVSWIYFTASSSQLHRVRQEIQKRRLDVYRAQVQACEGLGYRTIRVAHKLEVVQLTDAVFVKCVLSGNLAVLVMKMDFCQLTCNKT